MKKKSLSLALALVMCLSLLPAAASAAGRDEICTQNEWEVLIHTNQERLKEGLSPLSVFAQLQNAADVREAELDDVFSHTRPNGKSCFTALDEAGVAYSGAGENIAGGYGSGESVVNGWMDSEGHRANILTSYFNHIGIGNRGRNWVQLFTQSSRCSVTRISLSQTSVVCPAGTGVDELGLYVTAQCSVHGTCYLPVLDGMCTGFSASATGMQTVTVSYGGQSAQFRVWINPFTDVSANDYFTDPVAWAVEQGITNGREAGSFAPYAACNQQEIIVMLWRAAGQPAAAETAPVTADGFAADAVNWAYAQGMIDASFERYAPCTRATAVNWIWMAGGSPAAGAASFDDVPAEYAAPVAWAVEHGVTYGNDEGNFDPDGICNRAQIVTFLYRAR